MKIHVVRYKRNQFCYIWVYFLEPKPLILYKQNFFLSKYSLIVRNVFYFFS